jgi:hypothetical protein
VSESVPTEQDLLRKALFVPCESKQELHDWFEVYLGIDFPDTIVSEDSNSSPMDMAWLVYDAFRSRRYNLPHKDQYKEIREIMAYASRDSFKTLGVAALEVVVMLHMSLSVAHMAAIEKQAKKAQQYVKESFNKEHLRDFLTIKNETRIEVTRYANRLTGVQLTQAEFEELSPPEKTEYDRKWNYLTIVVCTMAGANSEHVPFMVVDEVDVVLKQNVPAYEEAKLIPSPWQGVRPITLYTSTRKFSFGLVQKELDEAEETGLLAIHWNIVDVTEKCPPERHLPQEPKIPIWYREPGGQNRGISLSEDDFKLLSDEKKKDFKQTEGFVGCLKNCKFFFACRGQLASKQKEKDSPLSMLKEIDHSQGLFRKVSPGMGNAQLLCKKPSEEGLIFARLDREIHMLTAAEMAEKITGDEYEPNFTKAQLLALMKDRGMTFSSGMDHGHAHNFAVVTGGLDGHRAFIIDVQSAAELELAHKIKLLTDVFGDPKLPVEEKKGMGIEPKIYGDTADPGSNKSIRKAGFKIADWKKGPDSVYHGIEVLRSKIDPAIGDPEIFFLSGDPGVELLYLRMSKYHWTLDEAGRPTNIPDDENDDEVDACRYLIMNEFKPRGAVIAALDDKPKDEKSSPIYTVPTEQNYLSMFIQEALGMAPGQESTPTVSSQGKSGRFIWDI